MPLGGDYLGFIRDLYKAYCSLTLRLDFWLPKSQGCWYPQSTIVRNQMRKKGIRSWLYKGFTWGFGHPKSQNQEPVKNIFWDSCVGCLLNGVCGLAECQESAEWTRRSVGKPACRAGDTAGIDKLVKLGAQHTQKQLITIVPDPLTLHPKS